MTMNFAAAMRRAALATRAFDVREATRIIQGALAGNTQEPAPYARAELANRHEPLRKPDAQDIDGNGQTLQPLRNAQETFHEIPAAFRKRPVGLSPIPAEGAQFISRSFSCVAGTRSYKLYIPASAPSRPSGLIVMLHGCKQNPDDFALGTSMNDVAERHGLIVAYPGQNVAGNASSCWNWFSPGDQHRDRGEPAIIAGMTRELVREFSITADRTFVAGLSAGGAMAVIMGETYPDLYAGIGIHSGLAYGSATDVMTAMTAMRGGGSGHAAAAMRASSRRVRTIIFHGASDRVVHPSNADHILACARPQDSNAPASVQKLSVNGRSITRTSLTDAKGVRTADYWLIDGLGHAWSGGKRAGSFTDQSGPDASAEMVAFFLEGS